MDWAAYLEYLQIVFQKFDAYAIISKSVLIFLFCNGLRLSIHAQVKQDGHWKNIWEQAIKKVITAKAKAAFNLPSWVQEMDACCPWSHQSFLKKDKCTKEKDFHRNSPQLFQCSKNTENSNKPWKDHKSNKRNRRGCHDCSLCGTRLPGFILATRVNTILSFAWNNSNRNRPSKRKDKNLSQVTCYNCNNKGHFANHCTKLHKPKN